MPIQSYASPRDIDLALLAYDAYTPSNRNRVLPTGWQADPTPGLTRSNPSNGFAAAVYIKDDEVVIAFRGTDDPKSCSIPRSPKTLWRLPIEIRNSTQIPP